MVSANKKMFHRKHLLPSHKMSQTEFHQQITIAKKKALLFIPSVCIVFIEQYRQSQSTIRTHTARQAFTFLQLRTLFQFCHSLQPNVTKHLQLPGLPQLKFWLKKKTQPLRKVFLFNATVTPIHSRNPFHFQTRNIPSLVHRLLNSAQKTYVRLFMLLRSLLLLIYSHTNWALFFSYS